MIEMADEEPDPSIVPEVEEMFEDFKNRFETLRMKTLLSGEYDDCNAIVTLHAGTGGTEAMDWTGMLYRMYSRWAESHGFQVEVLDSLDGDEAGLKSITFQVNGENAYGLLKSEHGVHRLVRISPFNANGKRQTSFSACEVMPDIEEDLDIEIDPKDIRIDTYRSSGAGGQHINKTSSAIRITHFPTGIVVTCQNERSQFQNKDKAFQELKIKLFMLKQQENAEKLDDIRGKVTDIAWGNQIRSYRRCWMAASIRSSMRTSSGLRSATRIRRTRQKRGKALQQSSAERPGEPESVSQAGFRRKAEDMINIAIMGYGTVGAGVFKVLKMNSEAITRRVGHRLNIKYVLDRSGRERADTRLQ